MFTLEDSIAFGRQIVAIDPFSPDARTFFCTTARARNWNCRWRITKLRRQSAARFSTVSFTACGPQKQMRLTWLFAFLVGGGSTGRRTL